MQKSKYFMFTRFIYAAIFLSFICPPLFSQQIEVNSAKRDSLIFTYVEKMPEFPGGQTELVKFLSENLQYPDSARHAGIEGKVIADFIVNEDGSISDETIIRGLGYGCDQEVLRVIALMPKWSPGQQNGTPVKVYFTLPVTFKLEEADPTRPNITSPSYPGGDDSLHAFVQKNLIYPKEAKKKKIEGQVVLSFDVDATGKTQNVVTYKSLGYGCDEEAQRILNLIPHWNPGTKNRKPVSMPYYMEVEFKLPSGKK